MRNIVRLLEVYLLGMGSHACLRQHILSIIMICKLFEYKVIVIQPKQAVVSKHKRFRALKNISFASCNKCMFTNYLIKMYE